MGRYAVRTDSIIWVRAGSASLSGKSEWVSADGACGCPLSGERQKCGVSIRSWLSRLPKMSMRSSSRSARHILFRHREETPSTQRAVTSRGDPLGEQDPFNAISAQPAFAEADFHPHQKTLEDG